LIPVDYTFSLLSGDDLLPDLAVGRIAAQTLAEATAVVDKIELYEQSFETSQPWQEHVVFVADDTDGGGNFCAQSEATATRLPDSLDKTFLCLPAPAASGVPIEQSTAELRQELFEQINDVGMAILNYRGHGGVTGWANPSIMHIDDAALWQNAGHPPVVLSADCLDGHFAKTDKEGLGETILEQAGTRGSVAHWSSTGLGFTFEHSVLHRAFYDAIFRMRLTAIGDVANYAKNVYLAGGYDRSEVYAFTLLGDPAMAVFPWRPTHVRLARFEAMATTSGVRLEWDVETEVGTAGYKISRGSGGAFAELADPKGNGDLFIVAEGGPFQAHRYVAVDETAEYGASYTYQLVEITAGSREQVQAEASVTMMAAPP
jgi:hypothetical protein